MSTSFPPWTDEHDMIRRTVRQFAEERLYPHRQEWDKQGNWPAREMFKEMADLGLLGIRVDEKFGGMGLDWWANTAFAEELGWARNAGVVMSILVNTDMATGVISEIGTDEQKEMLVIWRDLKTQKKKLSKKKKKANAKLQSIKEKIGSIELKQKKLKPSLKKLKKDFIPPVSIGYDKRWATFIEDYYIRSGINSSGTI